MATVAAADHLHVGGNWAGLSQFIGELKRQGVDAHLREHGDADQHIVTHPALALDDAQLSPKKLTRDRHRRIGEQFDSPASPRLKDKRIDGECHDRFRQVQGQLRQQDAGYCQALAHTKKARVRHIVGARQGVDRLMVAQPNLRQCLARLYRMNKDLGRIAGARKYMADAQTGSDCGHKRNLAIGRRALLGVF